ncbi:Hypp184 [Branchiostoma lanceolatum]|uniref:Hypp184 protein n=1 Tax=Branchiostoma lanceolatum TaxID=7740 RepID=A0A8J9VAT7_BRALA|nr:Hypp184 [Branchiostoma lanceolatum]
MFSYPAAWTRSIAMETISYYGNQAVPTGYSQAMCGSELNIVAILLPSNHYAVNLHEDCTLGSLQEWKSPRRIPDADSLHLQVVSSCAEDMLGSSFAGLDDRVPHMHVIASTMVTSEHHLLVPQREAFSSCLLKSDTGGEDKTHGWLT